MPQSNVKTPRFFINDVSYAIATNIFKINFEAYTDTNTPHNAVFDSKYGIFNGNPSNPSRYSLSYGEHLIQTYSLLPNHDIQEAYVALCGHNHSGYSSTIRRRITINNKTIYPSSDGFYLKTYSNGQLNWNDGDVTVDIVGANDLHIGEIFIGTYYDMPQNPNLDLKIINNHKGISSQDTITGSTITNASYIQIPDWGDIPAWQESINVKNHRYGKRAWELSFSYLHDTDVFPVNSKNTTQTSGDNSDYAIGDILNSTQQFTSNILTGNNFFSRVWNRTLGGNLPFIFQPDKTNDSIDQFAICKFSNNSLELTQVAHNVYNISLKIEEVY